MVLMLSVPLWVGAEHWEWNEAELFVHATQLIKNQEFTRARVILTQLVKKGQERFQEKYLLFLSFCNYRLGDYQLALQGLKLVRRITQLDEVKIRVDRLREKILLQVKDHGQQDSNGKASTSTGETQQEFLDLGQMNADTKQLLRGVYHLKMHNFATAMEIFGTLYHERKIPAALLYLGFVHYLAGNFSQSEYYWQQLKVPALIALREKILAQISSESVTKGKMGLVPVWKTPKRGRQHFWPLRLSWGYDDNPHRVAAASYPYLPTQEQGQGLWQLQGAYLYNLHRSSSQDQSSWAAFYQYLLRFYTRLEDSDPNNLQLHLAGLSGEWHDASSKERWQILPTLYLGLARFGSELSAFQGGLDLQFCYRFCPSSGKGKWGLYGRGGFSQLMPGNDQNPLPETLANYGGGVHWSMAQQTYRLEVGQQLIQYANADQAPALLYLTLQTQQLGQRALLWGGELWWGEIRRSYSLPAIITKEIERVDRIGKITLNLVHPFHLNWQLAVPIFYQWSTVMVDQQDQEKLGFGRWFFQLKLEGSF